MTQFWRPAKQETWAYWPKLRRKQLGHGYYVLWARCDLCYFSGASTQFVHLWKRNEDSPRHVCADCAGHEDLCRELLADGWNGL